MLAGYSFLFYQLMKRLRDDRGPGAEDRWASATIALFYVVETIAVIQAFEIDHVGSMLPFVSSVVIVCVVFGTNYLLFMRSNKWEELSRTYEDPDPVARRTSVRSMIFFLVVSAAIVAAATSTMVAIFAG